MKTLWRLTIFGLLMAGSASVFAQKPDFNGSWTMDRARSFGIPPDMNQTVVVTQTAAEIIVETKLIQPGNERTVKDTYVLDGKEYEFTPQSPPGQAPPKGKRTVNWIAAGNGLLVTEVITAETPKGPATTQNVLKWTITNGELVIARYVDTPTVSFEAKRIFKKNP